MSSHDDLGRALRDRADTMGDGRPLSLDDVKGRARGIRRRRYAATGLAAAAVLAIAVPAGVVVANNATSSSEAPPAQQDRSESPRPTEPAEEAPVVTLDNAVDARSGQPGIDYMIGSDLVTADQGTLTVEPPSGGGLQHRYDAFVRTTEAWLALWRDDQGRTSVDFVKRGGIVFDTRRSGDSLAVSADGSVGVYSTPEGELRSFSVADDNLAITDASAAPPDVAPVGVSATRSCRDQEPNGGACTVFYNDRGADPSGYHASWGGTQERLRGARQVDGVSPDGWLSVTVSASDTGSCSEMWTDHWSPEWRTCDYTLGKFSPDGKHVLAYAPQRDGIGDSMVAILDAGSGEPLVEYRNDAVAQAFVNNAVWDTDGTVLATVFARGHWSLMRMTADAELSVVEGMEDLGSSDVDVPLVLATGP